MIKPIAIHLPQFHPTSENDEWWGKGFTEWTNVSKAKPLFKNHYQPHLPRDLGYYDLRLEEARMAQIALAKQYGIYGFCYYHYWFNGKRVLEKPLDLMLNNKKENFPFMLCWANENWTRRWDGMDKEILLEQNYNTEDHIHHIRFLIDNFFKDSRYIKVGNKPFFVVYRPQLIPDIKIVSTIWEDECKLAGFEGIYLACMQRAGFEGDLMAIGFDAAIEFKPDFISNPPHQKAHVIQRILNKVAKSRSPFIKNQIIEYQDYVLHSLKKISPGKIFPGVTPMWDNSARKKGRGAFILKDSTPDLYEYWLHERLKSFIPFSDEECFVFINAWNEWAEGNHLEPCQKWGHSYLLATQRAILKYNGD